MLINFIIPPTKFSRSATALMYKLPLDSSPGADTITAEHLCYCDPSICQYLSIFFKMCLYHNFVPLGCLDTIIVPVVKNANGNLQVNSNQRWSPRGRPWPRGHILKSLALASRPQVFENCSVLGSRTALFFEQLKFRWKATETSRKICEHLFCFPH